MQTEYSCFEVLAVCLGFDYSKIVHEKDGGEIDPLRQLALTMLRGCKSRFQEGMGELMPPDRFLSIYRHDGAQSTGEADPKVSRRRERILAHLSLQQNLHKMPPEDQITRYSDDVE
jgi:hypothetical protein